MPSAGSTPDCDIVVGTDVSLWNVSVCARNTDPKSLPSNIRPMSIERLSSHITDRDN